MQILRRKISKRVHHLQKMPSTSQNGCWHHKVGWEDTSCSGIQVIAPNKSRRDRNNTVVPITLILQSKPNSNPSQSPPPPVLIIIVSITKVFSYPVL